MSRQRRWRFSPTQITDVWRRWKAEQSLHEIGHTYGKPHPSIRCVLLHRGGIAPAARRRSRLALKLAEPLAMVVVLLTVPMMQIAKPGFRPCVRRDVSSREPQVTGHRCE